MTHQNLKVIAHLAAKSGKGDELGELLMGLIKPTRAETGCISYELWRNRQTPEHFTFVEEWVDEPALGAHFETDHIKDALSKLPALLDGELDLRTYSRLA